MSPFKNDKTISRKEAYLKACHYCAYQERLQEEVRQKLRGYKLGADDVEDLISELILNNYLNEERYAKAYAGGKFRIKKWGRLKIIRNLEMKKVSAYCINKGLSEIDESDYMKTLEELLKARRVQLNEENEYVVKHKISSYAIGKGYEPELVWEILGS